MIYIYKKKYIKIIKDHKPSMTHTVPLTGTNDSTDV